jgi:hypothetical protein
MGPSHPNRSYLLWTTGRVSVCIPWEIGARVELDMLETYWGEMSEKGIFQLVEGGRGMEGGMGWEEGRAPAWGAVQAQLGGGSPEQGMAQLVTLPYPLVQALAGSRWDMASQEQAKPSTLRQQVPLGVGSVGQSCGC